MAFPNNDVNMVPHCVIEVNKEKMCILPLVLFWLVNFSKLQKCSDKSDDIMKNKSESKGKIFRLHF